MDIRQLKTFICVADHLSFTKAADELYTSQSSISHQIAELEEQVGAKLFFRTKRAVQLTPAGTVFLKEAIQIVEKTDEAVTKTRQTESGIIGSLSIGFLAAHIRHFLPDVVKRFRGLYPKIEVHMNHFPRKMLKEALAEEEIDVAFCLASGLEKMDGIETRMVLNEPYCIVVHRNHPLAKYSKLKLTDLINEPFVIHRRDDSPVMELCQKSGFSPNIVSQPRFIDAVPILVESEMGISILPKSFEYSSGASLRFIEMESEVDHHLQLVAAWKKSTLNPSVPSFLNHLFDMLGDGLECVESLVESSLLKEKG